MLGFRNFDYINLKIDIVCYLNCLIDLKCQTCHESFAFQYLIVSLEMVRGMVYIVGPVV